MAYRDFTMNRINPLHIGLLLVTLLIFLVINLSNTKRELAEATEAYTQTAKLSTHLSGLKEVYDNKEKIKLSIEKILEQASFKSAKIEQELKTTQMIIHSQAIDITTLNALMSQLLNGSYIISTFNITKLSETHASIYIELTW